MAAGIPFQLRTPVDASEAGGHAYDTVCRQLRGLGAPEPVRQTIRPAKTTSSTPL